MTSSLPEFQQKYCCIILSGSGMPQSGLRTFFVDILAASLHARVTLCARRQMEILVLQSASGGTGAAERAPIFALLGRYGGLEASLLRELTLNVKAFCILACWGRLTSFQTAQQIILASRRLWTESNAGCLFICRLQQCRATPHTDCMQGGLENCPAAKRLEASLNLEREACEDFLFAVTDDLLSPWQEATCEVYSYPWHLDMLSICNELAGQHKQSTVGVQLV